MLRRMLQPNILILFSIVLVASAGFVLLSPTPRLGKPAPLPLAHNEEELAWLYPATAGTAWERLASAVQQTCDRLQAEHPGLQWQHDSGNARFSWLLGDTSSATPEVAFYWPDGRRLVIRWYKLTSQWTPAAWIEALMARGKPPLAVIGGSTSHWAQELARALHEKTAHIAAKRRPLLLLTQATADSIVPQSENDVEHPEVRLTEIYRHHPEAKLSVPLTFRFCFTNEQMASTVTRFIWSRPELAPEGEPAYLVRWIDESYSMDLSKGYRKALTRRNPALTYRASGVLGQQVSWLLGASLLRLPPGAIAGWYSAGIHSEMGVVDLEVSSSVGTFASTNPFEERLVRDFLNHREKQQPDLRLLLVITGQAQPSRRFLRDLARSAPVETRRFVVAMGDALAFNAIYRDRQVSWPIKDLPFPLVFFAHRNPIDEDAGFSPAEGKFSGTEDLLLYREIVEATALAFHRDAAGCHDAEDLARGLLDVRLRSASAETERPLLFDPSGERARSSGEHVIWLQPHFKEMRVLPQAMISVWTCVQKNSHDALWEPVGKPLQVDYDEAEVPHGEHPRD